MRTNNGMISLFGDEFKNEPTRRCRDCKFFDDEGGITLCARMVVLFPDGRYKKVTKMDKACTYFVTGA